MRPTTARHASRRFVARARRCAPLAQYQLLHAASKRPAGKAAIAALRADGCRAQPATTREARPRSAQPVRSLRGGSSITVARPALRCALVRALVLTPTDKPKETHTNARPRAGGCAYAPVTPPAIAARLGRLRQVSRPLLRPSPPLSRPSPTPAWHADLQGGRIASRSTLPAAPFPATTPGGAASAFHVPRPPPSSPLAVMNARRATTRGLVLSPWSRPRTPPAAANHARFSGTTHRPKPRTPPPPLSPRTPLTLRPPRY